MTFDVLKPKIAAIISDSSSKDRTMQLICELLKTEIPHYDWVGFYFRNGDKEELKLGPYSAWGMMPAKNRHIILQGRGERVCNKTVESR